MRSLSIDGSGSSGSRQCSFTTAVRSARGCRPLDDVYHNRSQYLERPTQAGRQDRAAGAASRRS